MSNVLILPVTAGTPLPVDMLCPACGADAMYEIPLLSIHGDGVSEIGRTRVCDNCLDHPSE